MVSRSSDLFAREELAEALKLAYGSTTGYIPWATTMLGAVPGGKKVSSSMVGQVVWRQKAAPLWMAVAFARIVSENLTMSRDEAYEYATKRLFDEQESGGDR